MPTRGDETSMDKQKWLRDQKSTAKQKIRSYTPLFILTAVTSLWGTTRKIVFNSHFLFVIKTRFRSIRSSVAWGTRVALRRPRQNRLKIGERREGTVSDDGLES